MSNDDGYIKMRKRKAFRLGLLFRLFRVFPVRKNKVVFSAFEGDGGFCCNPRYIAEELHRRNPKLKFIWLVKDTKRYFPDWIVPVKSSTLSTAYHLSTAKVWVDNYRKPFGTLKRKSQFYVQTWHASFGFKAVGLFRGDAFPKIARLVSEWDSSLIDCMVSNSAYCDKIYPKKILYNGSTLRSGSPRVDCLVTQKPALHQNLRTALKLDADSKLLLFAPTFRGGNQNGKKVVISEGVSVDFDRLLAVLSKKFGGTWTVLLRLHPQLSANMEKMPGVESGDRLIDVSQMPDISQVLGGCDALMTDYSSCAFDAAFAGIPVFLYADDIKDYAKDRGEFMWKREELPFSFSENNDELENIIRGFDSSEYERRVKEFMCEHEVIEDGHASERVADVVEGHMTI